MNIQELKLKSSEQLITQAEDGIRDRSPSRGLGDVYKRQLLLLFQPQIGLKIAKNTMIIKITVGISLIILKNFADLVFVEFFRATRHFPK